MINDEKIWHKLDGIEGALQRQATETKERAELIADNLEYQEAKFEKHLEVYANNNLQIKRNNENIQKLTEMFEAHTERMQPVIEAFNGLTWSKRLFVWIIVTLGTIVSLILAFRQLFKND